MKGIDVLLKGFSQFIQKTSFTHVSLKIVGDGPDANAFLELVKALGLQSFVTFLGAQPFERVNKFYQEAHCFVHASRHESFSLVCAEAQASGLPVITTKCGGPESIVTQSSLGIVVENENHHAFANAMWEVYENYHSYDANTIREHFIQKFSRPIVSKKILQLYSDVIRA